MVRSVGIHRDVAVDEDNTAAAPEAFRSAIDELMARCAAGDHGAVWELHTVAEPALSRIVRSEARRLDLRLHAEDVLDITLDAAIEIGKLAPSWKPDGALPWVWARLRINGLVHDHVGTFADELDETHLELVEPPVPDRIDDPLVALRLLARRHPSARFLDERLSAVSERDASIYLSVKVEKAAGNRSPAVTVGVDHGLRPDAVRKVFQRVTERLGEVA